jgi:hypothetical protein
MFTFTVAPDGAEQYVVTVAIRDTVAWERLHPGHSAQELIQEDGKPASLEANKLTNSFELAYFASKRQGLFVGSLEDFETTCDVVGIAQEAPDPTHPDRSDDSASSSRSGPAPRRGRGKTATTAAS